jgi:CRP-like cAMP-binding protein
VGLGFLEKHILTARALLASSVTCVPADETEDAVKHDPRARAKLAEAADQEIEARREELFKAGQRHPIERVAALLVTSSRTNRQQGRRADLIEDSWRCGVIADLLQLDLDDLRAILVELERRGLVETTTGSLRLKDIGALENLADRLGTESGAQIRPRPVRPPKLVSRTAA